MMILLIDNYDSLTFNLVHLVGSFNQDIQVVRNDEMTVDKIDKLPLSHIIISSDQAIPRMPEYVKSLFKG